MTLLLTMLPIYIFGNLHCIGMCGPLVMMLGQHRFRYFYFLGRLFSFTFAGLLAGGLGSVLELILKQYNIPAMTSFVFGGGILMLGIFALLGKQHPGAHWIARTMAPFQKPLSLLIMKDSPWATFLFGFMTIALPCGQTIIVFSACALSGDAFIGMINGFAFALLTSPSLFIALQAHTFLNKAKKHYQTVMGLCALLVGTLALCRGFAEVGLIPHWILNPHSAPEFHLVMF